MNKYSLIEKIELALDKAGIAADGALSIDYPIDSEPQELFVYDMSYSTFNRELIAIYTVATDTVRQPNF